MNRYARQMILPEIGQDGQQRLASSHVLVVGAGGLGCPVLQYLTGAGVGQITLIDPDIVEESNLHRQPLYRMSDLGQPKAEAARAALLGANPEVQVTAVCAALHPSNAPDLVRQADVVIDAADSFAVSYILSDACQEMARPLISASVLGQSGYAGGFCGAAPSLRAVFPEVPDRADSCASAGVMGPVVGMVGALQAQMALRILTGATVSPLGQMVTLDLETLRFGGFGFLGTPEPADRLPFVARDMLAPSDRVIELRDADEAPDPVCPDALRLDLSRLTSLPQMDGQRTVLCCQSGLRAWHAATVLQDAGHRNLALLAAGASA